MLGALAIGFSGCASTYRNAPVVPQDVIHDREVAVWTNDGAQFQGLVEAVEDGRILLVMPDGHRERILLDDIRTLKYVSEDRQTPWGVKLALWTLGIYMVLGISLSLVEGSIGGS